MTRLVSNLEKLSRHRRIVLLQGPIGGFFQQLANWLGKQGSQVYKINFNGGDADYYRAGSSVYDYVAPADKFAQYLIDFIDKHKIDAVVCFGDTRIYHRIAKQVCQQAKVSFWVFEEGYFRPHWIVLEEYGVNAYSHLPRVAAYFQAQVQAAKLPECNPIKPISGSFRNMAWCALCYYWAMFWWRKRYPNYQHHRATSLSYYVVAWMRSGWRKIWYRWRERKIEQQIQTGEWGKFFIFPLQVATDSQIKVHSHYASMRDCLLHVLSSFAINAPADVKLVIKHHPMDRGFIDYGKDVHLFLQQHPQMNGRVIYVHDIALPILLRQGCGMVTVNSTSGLSALIHGLPVKTLGQAHYHIPNITSVQRLSEFWRNPQPPNHDLFHAYRQYHLYCTHINGNYYTHTRFPK